MTIRTDNAGNTYSGTFLNPTSRAQFTGGSGSSGTNNDIAEALDDGLTPINAGIGRDTGSNDAQFLGWRPLNNNGVSETNPNAVFISTASNGTLSSSHTRFAIGRGIDGDPLEDSGEGFALYRAGGSSWLGSNLVSRNNIKTPITRNFHLLTVNNGKTNLAWLGYDNVNTFSNLRFCWAGYLTVADRFGLFTDVRSRLCTLFFSEDNHVTNGRPYYASRITESNGQERFLRIGTDPEAEYAFDTTTVLDENDVDATELYLKDNNGPPYGSIGYLDNLFAVKGSYNKGDVISLRQGDAGGLQTSTQIKGADNTLVICVAPLYHASYGVPGKYLFMRIFPDLFV